MYMPSSSIENGSQKTMMTIYFDKFYTLLQQQASHIYLDIFL